MVVAGDADILIGANLRALRLYRGLTQSELAAMLGITFQQVQKYESGRNRLTAARLHALACYLDVPYGHFFRGMDAPANPALAELCGVQPRA